MGSFTSEDTDFLANFDIDLQRFYLEVLNKELDVRNQQNAENIKTALKEVVEAYKRRTGDGPDLAKSIRFDSSAKRCAYVLKHSPCFTSAVAGHFFGLLKECPRFFGSLKDCPRFFGSLKECPRVIPRDEVVSVCCLGGGPASDAVGVCKVLSAFCWQFRQRRLKMRVTVVDVNEDWAVTAGKVLETLKETPGLLGMEGVELSFDFFTADLTRPFEVGVRNVIGRADILTMVYFLSAVNRGSDEIKSFHMIKEIMKCMRDGAVLFFLDSAMDVHYKQMNSAAKSSGNMTQIYGPRIEEFHTLSLGSVQKFLELYKRDFGKFLCLTNCFVSSSAWRKAETTLSLGCKCESCSNKTTNLLILDEAGECLCESLDKLQLDRSKTLTMNMIREFESTSMVHRSLQDKLGMSLQQEKSNVDQSVRRLVANNKCHLFVRDESLVWRKSQRQAVSRLTAKMVQFRAQIGRLLAAEFEQVDAGDIENEVFDDIDSPPDDAFDCLLTEYFHSVPEYFFQTKSKKKRIFTGLPVSI